MADHWHQDDFQKSFNQQEERKSDQSSSAKKQEEKDRHASQGRSKKGGPTFKLLLLIVVIIVALFLLSGFYIVPEGKLAYVTQFGKIVRQTEESGIHYHLPGVQRANFLSSKIMTYDVNPSEVLTADKKAMIVDSYAIWRINDASRYIRTVSGNLAEMEKRIDASVYSNIKNLMGSMQQSEIISDEESSRDTLNQQVTKFSNEELNNYGIEVLRVEIKRYDLPVDNMSAVYKRMISERQQMAAAYKAEGEYEAAKMRNETDKTYNILIGDAQAEARRLEGEGEAEYMRILEELYGQEAQADYYTFMLELDALREGLKGDTTLVLGPDSFLGRMLISQEGDELASEAAEAAAPGDNPDAADQVTEDASEDPSEEADREATSEVVEEAEEAGEADEADEVGDEEVVDDALVDEPSEDADQDNSEEVAGDAD